MDYDDIVEYLNATLVDEHNCGLTIHEAHIPNGLYCEFNIKNLKGKTVDLQINGKKFNDISSYANKISVYRINCTVAVEDFDMCVEDADNVEISIGDCI